MRPSILVTVLEPSSLQMRFWGNISISQEVMCSLGNIDQYFPGSDAFSGKYRPVNAFDTPIQRCTNSVEVASSSGSHAHSCIIYLGGRSRDGHMYFSDIVSGHTDLW